MPQSSPQVPKSLTWRSLLAIALAGVFCAFGVAVIWGVLLLFVHGGGMPLNAISLSISLALAIVILIAILPKAGKFKAPWTPLTPEDHPLLFERLQMIAAAANTRMPDEVYMLPRTELFVVHVGTFRKRRVLGIGYGLINVLDLSEFSALIAHEFGHYRSRDTWWSSWIGGTHQAILRTLNNVQHRSKGLLEWPFIIYTSLYRRTMRAVYHEREFAADRFAASICGKETMVRALRKDAGYKTLVDNVWDVFILPSLGWGYRPIMGMGLVHLFESEEMAAASRLFAERFVANEKPGPAHPTLRDRIASLESLPEGTPILSGGPNSACLLLGNIRGLEDGILERTLKKEDIARLEPIEWDDMHDRVYFDRWNGLREHNQELLGSWTVDEMGGFLVSDNLALFLMQDDKGNAVMQADRLNMLFNIAVATLSLALIEAGWQFVARPDMGAFFVRGDGSRDTVDSTELMRELARREIAKEEWSAICNQTGISGLLLSGGKAVSGPGNRWFELNPFETLVSLNVQLEGGNGSSFKKRILLSGASTYEACVEAERAVVAAFIAREKCGFQVTEMRNEQRDNRHIHVVKTALANGRKRTFIFDVTACDAHWKKSEAAIKESSV